MKPNVLPDDLQDLLVVAHPRVEFTFVLRYPDGDLVQYHRLHPGEWEHVMYNGSMAVVSAERPSTLFEDYQAMSMFMAILNSRDKEFIDQWNSFMIEYGKLIDMLPLRPDGKPWFELRPTGAPSPP